MGKPSGSSTTTVHQAPPQLINEGRLGYEEANQFYRDTLAQPPVYTGQRVADMTPAQRAALGQKTDYFGTRQPYQTAAEDQVARTSSGGYGWTDPISPMRDETLGGTDYGLGTTRYGDSSGIGYQAGAYKANVTPAKSAYQGRDWERMSDEEVQKYIKNASEPILTEMEESIMPQIRDSSQLSGQGATSTRSDIARQKAVEGFGRKVGSSVIAPLMMEQERLDQDFTKAWDEYQLATAEGDANRANQASIEMARISAASHDVSNRINADVAMEGGRLRLAGQELQSREKIAGKGYQSQERQTAAELYNRERQGYAARNLSAWDSERGRQLQAAGMTPALLASEGYRTDQLYGAGATEQNYNQRLLDSQREIFEEPLYRQSQAASALAGMAGTGPGSSTSIQRTQGSSDTYGDVMQGVQTAAMVGKAVAPLFACSKQFKNSIETLSDEEREQIVKDILSVDVKKWFYNWDKDNMHEEKRTGPILEEIPVWMREDELSLNLVAILSGAIITLQEHNKLLRKLEAFYVQANPDAGRA